MKDSVLVVSLITCLLFLASFSVNGEIYKWVDDKGKMHFTDNPPSNKKVEEVKLKINSYTAVEVTSLVERLGRPDKVVIYTADWCVYCKQAIQYFKDNNITFVDYDIKKSRTGKIDYKLLRGTGVPIIIVGNKRMNGFSVSGFDQLYQEQLKKKQIEDDSRS